ncbi:hypothetical protein P3X46_020509 [Hevea brasiliensis]|uniref:Late embryogenesis abundant protein LEA-2 subgroup domain-containing protein n=2 Tax=Hevea brasiliensis TaxID=3981 RepID=A0ABQ9LP73_HEVBR|nr:hypothetical protein P3X46_020509 [Hevea brasiliensis]
MNNFERFPVRTGQEPPAIKRHHTPRYYAHRVRESLTTRVSKLICAIFLIILLVVGIVFFILWLSLRPHRPRIFIQDFSVPGLGQPNGFENALITFNVTARNSNQHIGFHYDNVEGSVYYKDQRIGYIPLLDPFYQEPKNTTIMYGVLSGATLTVNSQRWMEFLNDRTQGTVIFRLDITSNIQFKVSTWDSKRHRMHASCAVGVGTDGSILASYRNKRCPVYFT